MYLLCPASFVAEAVDGQTELENEEFKFKGFFNGLPPFSISLSFVSIQPEVVPFIAAKESSK